MLSASVYVHFPFCETRCHYCDFYSIAETQMRDETHGTSIKSPRAGFADAACAEITLRENHLAPSLKTLFFGGGTPSFTGIESIERISAALFRERVLAPDYEWTVELNPSSTTRDLLLRLKELGVNRLSFGVQSLDPGRLELLGRVHSRDRALDALESAFSAGFHNISTDLLLGVPSQTEADIEKDVCDLLRFPLPHMSCYLLTLKPGNRLFDRLPGEDTQTAHLEALDRILTKNGFEHYEISNFAKPGFRSRHNLGYWTHEPYLGIGPSAHSLFHEGTSLEPVFRRERNVASLRKYSERVREGQVPVDFAETLTPHQKELETWLLALRLADGAPIDWVRTVPQKAKYSQLLHRGLLEAHPFRDGHFRLTTRGFALSDQILAELTPA